MKAHPGWCVLSHGPLQKVTENLWRVEGFLPDIPIGRVMTLVKRTDGSVLVHSAIALEEDAMREIDAWGPVKWIVVPNAGHRLDAPAYKERYPEARVICPPGARPSVEEVLAVDETYDTFVSDDAVRFATLDGVDRQEGVMIVQSADGVTLVFNDSVFNLPHRGGVKGLILRYVTQSSGGPRVSRVARLLWIKDKQAFRSHLTRLAETPHLRRVIVAHKDMIEVNPGGALRQAAATV